MQRPGKWNREKDDASRLEHSAHLSQQLAWFVHMLQDLCHQYGIDSQSIERNEFAIPGQAQPIAFMIA
jgi:hypothetical protein